MHGVVVHGVVELTRRYAVDHAPQNRILRVAKEAKARRDKAAAIEAKKRAAREAEEAAREEQKRQERMACVQRTTAPPPSHAMPHVSSPAPCACKASVE